MIPKAPDIGGLKRLASDIIPQAPEIGGLDNRRELWAPRYGPRKDNNEPIVEITPRPVEGGEATSTCGFGSIYREDGDWYLRGGVVSAGPDNHEIDDQTFSVGTDLEHYLWLSMDITANTADGVLLPGIESSVAPTLPIPNGAAYPSSGIPTAAAPTKTIIIPLGLLTIEDGVPSYRHDGECSPITVSHCPGQIGIG